LSVETLTCEEAREELGTRWILQRYILKYKTNVNQLLYFARIFSFI